MIYIQAPRAYLKQNTSDTFDVWCELHADSIEELHTAAHGIGLSRKAFVNNENPQLAHYRLLAGQYRRALAIGARESLAEDVQERAQEYAATISSKEA